MVLVVDRRALPHVRGLLVDLFEQPEADTWERLGPILPTIGAWEMTNHRLFVADGAHSGRP